VVDRIRFEQTLVVDHATGFAAGELAPDDTAGVTEDGPGALVRQDIGGEAVPYALP